MAEGCGINDEAKYRLRQQAAIAELGEKALREGNLAQIMDETVRIAAASLHAEYCQVLELMPDGKSLLLKAGTGWNRELVGRAMLGAGPDSPAGYIIMSDESVVMDDLRTETQFQYPPLLKDQGIVSGIGVVIHGKDRPYGVLGAAATSPGAFTKNDAKFLKSLANVLAAAIERRRVDEALQEAEHRYRNIVEHAVEGIFQTTPAGHFVFANAAMANILGYDSAEELMDTVTDLAMQVYANPEDRKVFMDLLRRDGEMRAFETRARRKDGSVVWVSTNVKVVRDSAGAIMFFEGTVEDITERKQMEEELVRSRSRLAEAQQIAHVGSWSWDVQTQDLEWSDELYKLFGLDQEKQRITFERFLQLIHPDDMERFKTTMQEDLRSGKARDMNFRIILPGGSERHVSGHAELIHNKKGEPVQMLGTIQDITGQVQTEEELRLLQTITQAVSEAEDVHAALEVTLAKVCNVTGWTLGEAWVPSDEGSYLECSRAWYSNAPGMDEFREASCQFVFPQGVGLPGRVWQKKQPEWIEDVTVDGKFKRNEYARKTGLKAGVAIPVLYKREVIAVMDFFVKEPREEDGNFIDLISGVAAQLGSVIVRKRAEEKVREYNTLINAISRTLLSFVGGAKLSSIFDDLLYRVLFLTNSEFGFIGEVLHGDDGQPNFMIDAVTSISLDHHAAGFFKEFGPHLKLQDMETPYRKVIATGKPVILNEMPGNLLAGKAPEGQPEIRNFLGLPFGSGDRVVGMIGIANRKDGYSEEIVSYLQPLMITCANIIESQRSDQRRLRAEEDLVKSLETLKNTLEGTVRALASTTESRDPYTAGHQQRVSRLATALAREMGLSDERIEGIRVAGLLHDLGKMAVPVEILSKPGRISEHEFNIIEIHPQVSYDILKTIEFPWPVGDIAYQHHERMNGSGYPQGLPGDEIIMEARILAVADVVEAMSSHRPYRAARGMEEALEEIVENSGNLYDPDVVAACMRLCKEKGFTLD